MTMVQTGAFMAALSDALAREAQAALRHDNPDGSAIAASLDAVRRAVDEAARAAGMEKK